MDLKNKIISAPDLKEQQVSIPEWGGDYFLREFSALDRMSFRAEVEAFGDSAQEVKNLRFACLSITKSLVDMDGNQILDASDVDALMGKSLEVINRVSAAVLKLNGIGEHEVIEGE